MSKKTIGIIVAVVGVLLVIVALTADFIGIGTDIYTFGWAQILGVAVGVIVALVGGWLALSKPAQPKK